MMHHIQKKIIFKLTRAKDARFADIKPGNIDGNIFTYHLKQLKADRLVSKTDAGRYNLTQKGKLAGINILLDSKGALEQAHCVLFLAAKNDKGEYLLRKRLVHPAHGKVGFLHCEPVAGETILQTAERNFKERTGLSAKFKVHGSGYIQVDFDGELESFTQFTLLVANRASGRLVSPGDSGKNFWYSGDFDEPEMFPSMKKLVGLMESSQKLFFVDLKNEI